LEDMRALLRDPFLNSTEALAEHYDGLMCAQGYSSRLCTQCVFPGGCFCCICHVLVCYVRRVLTVQQQAVHAVHAPRWVCVWFTQSAGLYGRLKFDLSPAGCAGSVFYQVSFCAI
jgi:hypothetical protein